MTILRSVCMQEEEIIEHTNAVELSFCPPLEEPHSRARDTKFYKECGF